MRKGEKIPKKISIIEFSEKYATKEICVADLWERRSKIDFVCSKCGGAEGHKAKCRKIWLCKNCKHQNPSMPACRLWIISEPKLSKSFVRIILRKALELLLMVSNHTNLKKSPKTILLNAI